MNLNDDCGDKTSKVILLFYIYYFLFIYGCIQFNLYSNTIPKITVLTLQSFY